MIIPKFRVYDKSTKCMSNVEAIVYTEKRVYPFYSKVVRRYIPFEECVLMQSTSLKDKNGKEIFEGDIVKYKAGCNTFTEEVAYDKIFAGFGVKDANANIIFTFGELAEDIDLRSLEVIGSIYENPELLEGE